MFGGGLKLLQVRMKLGPKLSDSNDLNLPNFFSNILCSHLTPIFKSFLNDFCYLNRSNKIRHLVFYSIIINITCLKQELRFAMNFFRRKRSEPTPSIQEAMRMTGLSEAELERRFLEHLIQQGKNPFKDLPCEYRSQMEEEYPDLLELVKRKFGRTY
jgi:hypothetical protein